MKEEIFRKKSLERIQSPEDLNEYIHVVNPGVWLLLAAVTALLLGALVWGIFGRIDESIPAVSEAVNGTVVCCFDAASRDLVEAGAEVKFGEFSGHIVSVDEEIHEGKCFASVKPDQPVPDGIYETDIVTGVYRPISFILN